MVLPFVFTSCGNSIALQLKKEMQSLKEQCPLYQGDGVTITDVNFHEGEKVLEYAISIEGVEFLDAATVDEMKKTIVGALSSDISAFEKFSVKAVLKNGYKFHYIYTDEDGNTLCEIDITKDDLP